MSDYKLTDYVIGVVYGLLSGVSVPKYRHNKPSEAKDPEFVVINSFPIDANVLQKCIVNVNYHVKDIKPGIPNQTKLNAGALTVMNALKSVTATDKSYMIDFETSEQMQEQGQDEHFINMRFSFKNINN